MKEKYVNDNVWGTIVLTEMMQRFIDTYEFQRLRNIKQLGTAQFVYPGASNTRFEHSLGVSHLSRTFASKLTDDAHTVELIGLAGLLHDIGHGPMSHTFDFFCEENSFFSNHEFNSHENRSKAIIGMMVKKYEIPLSGDDVKFINMCISPPTDNTDWRYSIVSNEIDTDRMDYILRDSNSTGVGVMLSRFEVDNIIANAYVEQATVRAELRSDVESEGFAPARKGPDVEPHLGTQGRLVYHPRAKRGIKKLLESRTYMYENVYCHRVSKCINDLIIDLMKMVWKDRIGVMTIEEFLKFPFNDTLLDYYYNDPGPVDIIDKIYRRNFLCKKS